MVYRLDSMMEVDVTFDAKDDKGRDAAIENAAWTVDKPEHLTVVPLEDGSNGATLVPADVTGVVVVVTLSADADLDEGEARLIERTLEVAIVGGEAATLELTVAGEPRPKRTGETPVDTETGEPVA